MGCNWFFIYLCACVVCVCVVAKGSKTSCTSVYVCWEIKEDKRKRVYNDLEYLHDRVGRYQFKCPLRQVRFEYGHVALQWHPSSFPIPRPICQDNQ